MGSFYRPNAAHRNPEIDVLAIANRIVQHPRVSHDWESKMTSDRDIAALAEGFLLVHEVARQAKLFILAFEASPEGNATCDEYLSLRSSLVKTLSEIEEKLND